MKARRRVTGMAVLRQLNTVGWDEGSTVIVDSTGDKYVLAESPRVSNPGPAPDNITVMAATAGRQFLRRSRT